MYEKVRCLQNTTILEFSQKLFSFLLILRYSEYFLLNINWWISLISSLTSNFHQSTIFENFKDRVSHFLHILKIVNFIKSTKIDVYKYMKY